MNPSPRFRELAELLGGISDRALDSFFYWQGPWSLENWTMNVVEMLLLGMAAAGFRHAWVTRRRTGDASGLGIWAAAVGYCIAIEVPIYFLPRYLGLDEGGVIFIHNEFSTGLFFGRTPLYILALYPALLYPSYLLVRRLGVFECAGPLAVVATMGAVHHAFYAIFDHLGPQLQWWLWDPETLAGEVSLASVPHYSQVTFSMVGAGAFGLLAHRLIERRPGRVVAGAAKTSVRTIGLMMLFAPNVLYPLAVDDPNEVVVGLLAIGIWTTALVLAVRTLLARRALLSSASLRTGADRVEESFLRGVAVVFLASFTLLWAVAMPDVLTATAGVAPDGTPIGSPGYALVCGAVVVVVVQRAVGWKPPGDDRSASPRLTTSAL